MSISFVKRLYKFGNIKSIILEFLNLCAKDDMTEELITVSEHTILHEVKRIFDKNNIHHIPVIKDDMTLVGIISSCDLKLMMDWGTKFELERSDFINEQILHSQNATAICSKDLFTVSPETAISFCYEIFKTKNIRALPVVNKEFHIEGIVTPLDLVKALLKISFVSPL